MKTAWWCSKYKKKLVWLSVLMEIESKLCKKCELFQLSNFQEEACFKSHVR